jgi:branched-chain amino acid transport system substrate-binding protein
METTLKTDLSRRKLLKAGAALGASFVITRPGWAATGPIKLATIDPLSGPAAQYGQQNVMALQLAVDRVNRAGGLLGREVKVISLDYELKNDIGARRVREALQDQGADAITTFSGSVALIAAQAAARAKKFFVTAQAVPVEVTTSQFQPTTYVCAFSIGHVGAEMASFAAKSPLKNIFLFSPDNANGRGFVEGFQKRFAQVHRPEQRIVGVEYFTPFSVTDFSPYITKIEANGPCLIPSIAYGADLRNLLQQGHSLGWKQTVANWALDDPGMCSALGDAAVGHYAVLNAALTSDTPLMNQLIQEWTTKYKTDVPFLKLPVQAASRVAYSWLWFMDSVKRAGSLDVDAVAKAFEGSSFDTPWGRSTMRACDHQMISPGYYAQIVRPEHIPEKLRFFGNSMPYMEKAIQLGSNEIAIDVGTPNARCKEK